MDQFLQEHILPNIWGAVAATVGALWFWWRSKPKERIENDGGIVDNAKKVLEMSEDIAERLEKQLISSDGVIQALKEKLQIAIEGENTCKKALKAIKEELYNFKVLFEEQRIELDALKDECRLLRKAIEQNENIITNNSLHAN